MDNKHDHKAALQKYMKLAFQKRCLKWKGHHSLDKGNYLGHY